MNRTLAIVLFCITALPVLCQNTASLHGAVATIWSPQPLLKFDNVLPEATVRKQMVTSLRVSDVTVTLEHTELQGMQTRFGGEVGSEGDAATSLGWLCLHGSDAAGPWVLWLESGEMDGPNIGAFQWRRVASTAEFDERCQGLPDGKSKVELPISLRLGIPEAEVVRMLGRPSSRKDGTLPYEHEHKESIRGESYTSLNVVIVVIRNGVVWAIEAHQTTMS